MATKLLSPRILISIALCALLVSCLDPYTEPQPFDIIKGNVDLQQEYNKSKFTNPTLIQGQILSKNGQQPIARAKVSARIVNTDISYTTLSREDGYYSLYAEGQLQYVISAEKDGYDKSYYFPSQYDSVTNVYGDMYANILVNAYDPTPKFQVNHLGDKFLSYYASDLSFNGTNLLSYYDYNSYVIRYDNSGNAEYFDYYSYTWNYFGCETGNFYWVGYSGNYLGKLNISNGSMINSFQVALPGTSGTDVEFYNNNLWLLDNGNSLFKVTTTGAIVGSLDFSEVTNVSELLGITQANNFLYVLLRDTEGYYLLYKIDPTSLNIVSKGLLPYILNYRYLGGLTFDKTNFWTLDGNIKLVKLSIQE
jgi:hypothetical protein